MSPVTTLPSHDDRLRIVVARALHRIQEFFGIAVGDVETEFADRGAFLDLGELGEIGLGRADRIEGVRGVLAREEFGERLFRKVLVQRRQGAKAPERAGHAHRPRHIHIGGDQRKAGPEPARVNEAERAQDVDVVARIERRALGADQHVIEVELDVGLDAHRRPLVSSIGEGLAPSFRP